MLFLENYLELHKYYELFRSLKNSGSLVRVVEGDCKKLYVGYVLEVLADRVELYKKHYINRGKSIICVLHIIKFRDIVTYQIIR